MGPPAPCCSLIPHTGTLGRSLAFWGSLLHVEIKVPDSITLGSSSQWLSVKSIESSPAPSLPPRTDNNRLVRKVWFLWVRNPQSRFRGRERERLKEQSPTGILQRLRGWARQEIFINLHNSSFKKSSHRPATWMHIAEGTPRGSLWRGEHIPSFLE